MRISQQSLQLLKTMASKLEVYSQYFPTPLTLQGLQSFGDNAVESKSFKFLRYEIPIRLATIIREMNLLPRKFHLLPPIQQIIKIYEDSFDEILQYESAPLNQYSVLSAFTDSLLVLRERHNDVVEIMGKAVNDGKESLIGKSVTRDQLQYFLDRFFINRIGIRMLTDQHISLFGFNLNEDDRFVGCVDRSCDLLANVIRAYEDASFQCFSHLKRVPSCDVQVGSLLDECSPQTSSVHLSPYVCKGGMRYQAQHNAPHMRIVYVPHHLHYVLFELFKNAMRAVVESSGDSPDAEMSPLIVRLVKGKEDITIQISDRGNGISHQILDDDRIFRYTYSTAPKSLSSFASPMAGFGFGLPLSRLYMRYFSGDLRITSVQGFGTDAFLYLKRDPAQAVELLPLFNHTSASQYECRSSMLTEERDWSSREFSSTGVFPHSLSSL